MGQQSRRWLDPRAADPDADLRRLSTDDRRPDRHVHEPRSTRWCLPANVTISGAITGVASIDRIEYTLNGAPPVSICVACGVEPTFSFPVTLGPGANEIIVTAFDDSNEPISIAVRPAAATTPGAIENALMAVRNGGDIHLRWLSTSRGAESTEVPWRAAIALCVGGGKEA